MDPFVIGTIICMLPVIGIIAALSLVIKYLIDGGHDDENTG